MMLEATNMDAIYSIFDYYTLQIKNKLRPEMGALPATYAGLNKCDALLAQARQAGIYTRDAPGAITSASCGSCHSGLAVVPPPLAGAYTKAAVRSSFFGDRVRSPPAQLLTMHAGFIFVCSCPQTRPPSASSSPPG